MPSAPPSPFLPLVAYAEALCVSARVLLVGDARSEIAARLLERGARLVHVCDDVDARRAEGAQRTTDRAITFGALNDGSFALREGFFDLALVENLAAHTQPKQVLASISRLLAPRGAALVAAPNPEAKTSLLTSELSAGSLDYYALYDAVAASFPRVRMLGQVPFVGYAVVDFASEGESEVVFDTSLVPGSGEEPEYFVAVAGEARVPVDAYAVVQLPAAAVLESRRQPNVAEPRTEAPLPPPLLEAPVVPAARQSEKPIAAPAEPPVDDERRRQEAWIAELEGRAAAADERADAAEAELDELREQHGNLAQRARLDLEAVQAERDGLKAELERELRQKHDLGELLATARNETAGLQTQLKAQQEQVRTLQEQLKALQAQSKAQQAELEAQPEQAKAREEQARAHREQVQALEAQLASLTQKLTVEVDDGASSKELQQLEAQLTERGERIRKLERELREAERTGRELVRRLERQREKAAAPQAAAKAPPLAGASSAERVAELEAERLVLTWALAIARGEMPGGSASSLPPLPGTGDFSG
jgi:hypothetical protein